MQQMAATFETYQDDDGGYCFRLTADDGEVVADSGPYDSGAAAREGMTTLKRAAAEAAVPPDNVLDDPETGIHMHY
jgi:uncharacterized protein YegP (UPF0339 family)